MMSRGTLPAEPILIVDDERLIAESLRMTLERQGHKIIVAYNGAEAINLMQQHHFALVVCDLKLPGISGSEVLQFAEKHTPNTIRIALTGLADLDIISNAFNVGHATFFVTKPWDEVSLTHLIAHGLEKYRLLQENQRLNDLILMQHKELEKSHASLKHDLQLGARIHEELLLGKTPVDIPYASIASTTLPSRDIDGDFYDFFHLTDQLLDVVIGDVMGKGIPAALVGTALKSEFERFAMPFIDVKFCRANSGWEDNVLKPKEILECVHQKICKQLITLEYFATLFYGRFDFSKKTLTYVNCGSPKPIHFCKSDGSIKLLESNNFPIGTNMESGYEESCIPWQVGDFFLFYSDGITECRSPEGELFGIERLIQLVQGHCREKAHILVQRITDEIINFGKKVRFDDDVTMVIMEMQAVAKDLTLHEMTATFSSDLTQLPSVWAFVTKLCNSALGDSDKLCVEMQLAVNEAFCNIVQHGYKGSKEHAITMKGKLLSNGVRIDICDWGEEFDPGKIKMPKLDGEQESGFGFFIIRQIADQLTYFKKKSLMDKNKLCIFKNYYIS